MELREHTALGLGVTPLLVSCQRLTHYMAEVKSIFGGIKC